MDKPEPSPVAGLIIGGVLGYFAPFLLQVVLVPFLNGTPLPAFISSPTYRWVFAGVGAVIGAVINRRTPK